VTTPPPVATTAASPRPAAQAWAAGAVVDAGVISPRPCGPPARAVTSVSPVPVTEETSPTQFLERQDRSQTTLSPLPEDRQECIEGALRTCVTPTRDPQDPDQGQGVLDSTDPDGHDCTLAASISSLASDTTAAPDSIAPCTLRREPGDCSAPRTAHSASEASLHVAEGVPVASAPAVPHSATAAALPSPACSGASVVNNRPVSPLSHRWTKCTMSPQAAYAHPAATPSAASAPQVSSARQADFPTSSRSIAQSRTSPPRDRCSQLHASQGPARSPPPAKAPASAAPQPTTVPGTAAPATAGPQTAQSSPKGPTRSPLVPSQPIVHIATTRGDTVPHWTTVGTAATKPGERERFLSEITALREENKSLREVKQQQIRGGKVETAKRQTSCPVANVAQPQQLQPIRSLVQATAPQTLWAPCGGGAMTPVPPGMPWAAQGPIRQASTPLRQASSPLRQRNI